jgi:hypothetical protein
MKKNLKISLFRIEVYRTHCLTTNYMRQQNKGCKLGARVLKNIGAPMAAQFIYMMKRDMGSRTCPTTY